MLHRGREGFQGQKSCRHPDDNVWQFRPRDNARRFARLARRLVRPCLTRISWPAAWTLVCADVVRLSAAGRRAEPVPATVRVCLPALAGHASDPARLFAVIVSPAGPYFSSGAPLGQHRPHVRWSVGTGVGKCGGGCRAVRLVAVKGSCCGGKVVGHAGQGGRTRSAAGRAALAPAPAAHTVLDRRGCDLATKRHHGGYRPAALKARFGCGWVCESQPMGRYAYPVGAQFTNGALARQSGHRLRKLLSRQGHSCASSLPV